MSQAAHATPRLLMIGLDAADPELVERWTDDGTLPHLAALRRRGATGRVRGSARYLAGSPWPTFCTSQHPSGHGLYHDFQWRYEAMEFAAPTPDWIDPQPFWRYLEDGVEVVAYDVPFASRPRSFRGVEVTGWATHDKLEAASSYPPDLLAAVRARFGEWPASYEGYGPSRIEELLALRAEMIENTRRSAELARWLLERPWRFAVICFSALHRGGHRLWDRTSIKGPVAEEQGALFDNAIRDLYVACDRAVGELVAAHPDADVLVFSVHGMMPNTSRVDLLDGMLARVLADGGETKGKATLLRRAGEALPHEWRRSLTERIPLRLRNRLMTAWTAGGIDWSKTKAFTCRADLQGYIRINLKGREPRGIVEAGAGYDGLCDRIAQGLASFRDAETGEPFIAEIRRIYRDRLPDLVVIWTDTPSAPHRAVVSPRFGSIARATAGRVPNGRSANHRGEGIVIACGNGIAPGVRLGREPDIVDLAPTALARLGARCRLSLAGTAIPELARVASEVA